MIEYQLLFVSNSDVEVNTEFYEGVKTALNWVLGYGVVWPPHKGHGAVEEDHAGQGVADLPKNEQHTEEECVWARYRS